MCARQHGHRIHDRRRPRPSRSVSTRARPISLVFDGCTEFAGRGTLPESRIAGRLPQGHAAASFGPGVAGVVARAARCERVSVDGRASDSGVSSQIGIHLVAPDGTGDINIQSLLHLTDNRRFADQLRDFGLPAQHQRRMIHEVNPAATALVLFVQVEATSGNVFFHGRIVDPLPGTKFPFLANWWCMR